MDEVDELDADDDDEDESDGKPKGGKPLKTLYELNDTLFAEAEVDEDGNVGLWLGVSLNSSSLFVERSSLRPPIGQYYASVSTSRGRSPTVRKACGRQAVTTPHERGSGIPERANHGHGGQLRKGA